MSKQIIIGAQKASYEITDKNTQEKRSGISLTLFLVTNNITNNNNVCTVGNAVVSRKMDYNVFVSCTGKNLDTADDMRSLVGQEIYLNTESKVDNAGRAYDKVTGVFLLPKDPKFAFESFLKA